MGVGKQISLIFSGTHAVQKPVGIGDCTYEKETTVYCVIVLYTLWQWNLKPACICDMEFFVKPWLENALIVSHIYSNT